MDTEQRASFYRGLIRNRRQTALLLRRIADYCKTPLDYLLIVGSADEFDEYADLIRDRATASGILHDRRGENENP